MSALGIWIILTLGLLFLLLIGGVFELYRQLLVLRVEHEHVVEEKQRLRSELKSRTSIDEELDRLRRSIERQTTGGGIFAPRMSPYEELPKQPPPTIALDKLPDEALDTGAPSARARGKTRDIERIARSMPRAAASPSSFESLFIGNRETLVGVHYATNRTVTGQIEPENFYDANRGDLRFGIAMVSIPPNHTMGKIEMPRMWRLEFQANPSKHVVLRNVTEVTKETFFESLKREVEHVPKKSAFVFIHGFNVSFAAAARRTAQMAYDLFCVGCENNLATLSIVPILYSWPSNGAAILYPHDANNADASVAPLKSFLADVAARSGATSVTVIAHSMGNRALALALNEIGLSMGDGDAPLVKEVILAAPDIDRGVFINMADAIARTGKRMTLYASGSDRALLMSKALNGFPRLGDSTDGIAVWKNADSIDASVVGDDILAHSYYGETSVLFDLYNLIMHGHAPQERFGLLAKGAPPSVHWMMRPRAN